MPFMLFKMLFMQARSTLNHAFDAALRLFRLFRLLFMLFMQLARSTLVPP